MKTCNRLLLFFCQLHLSRRLGFLCVGCVAGGLNVELAVKHYAPIDGFTTSPCSCRVSTLNHEALSSFQLTVNLKDLTKRSQQKPKNSTVQRKFNLQDHLLELRSATTSHRRHSRCYSRSLSPDIDLNDTVEKDVVVVTSA